MSQQHRVPVMQASAPFIMSQRQQPVAVTKVSTPVTASQQQPMTVTKVSAPVTQSQQPPFHPHDFSPIKRVLQQSPVLQQLSVQVFSQWSGSMLCT